MPLPQSHEEVWISAIYIIRREMYYETVYDVIRVEEELEIEVPDYAGT